MKMNYISKIQSGLKLRQNIRTTKATKSILDGSYHSVYKGRSMNFDELREYVPGDDIKDIDWKASARSQRMLVKQYIAEKKHNIMLIFDTNKKMLADTSYGEEKREVALMAAGTFAYLVNRNGDFISSIYSDDKKMCRHPFRTGLANIENILVGCHRDISMQNESDINASIEYVTRNYRQSMIIAIITDMDGIHSIQESTLKKLLILHDVLLINISDADKYGTKVFDINEETYLPDFFTKDKKLAKIEAKKKKAIEAECDAKLKKLGIACETIDSTKGIDLKIVELLNKHGNEKR